LVSLNSQMHRILRLEAARAVLDHAHVNAVAVIPREFARLLAHYPIFFTKNPENGKLEPAAILGFEQGENLFLKESTWDAAYIPLQIQRQPFALIPRHGLEGTQPALDLALDLESPHVQANNGERLFQDDGRPTAFLQNVSSMMSALVSGTRETYAFTERLAELNLLEPVQIDIEFVNRSQTKFQGLYWIAAAALKALTAAQLAELRDREYLEWMYFQMASLAHVAALVARKNQQLLGVAAAPTAAAATPTSE
jgi:hypothetical protein